MKVFISWSGAKSLEIGKIFNDWLPDVIQAIKPYISSEINKGARWSSDIAHQLADSTFGILCVTKENFEAPWLSFEAGALSKTIDKSFVTPFLFDVKPTDVQGPMLQFQATLFSRDDIKKLVVTLNEKCGDQGLAEKKLDEAFEVWFPRLEEKLNVLKKHKEDTDDQDTNSGQTRINEIIEEILELSRDNQKMLGSADSRVLEGLDQIKELMGYMNTPEMGSLARNKSHRRRRNIEIAVDALMSSSAEVGEKHHGLLVVLSFLKTDYPWIYDSGKEMVNTFNLHDSNGEAKEKAKDYFIDMISFTLEHPVMMDAHHGQEISGVSYYGLMLAIRDYANRIMIYPF